MRFGISTRIGRHLRVGMSVPVQVQPRYKSRMKPTKPERVEGVSAIGGVFIIIGITVLVALALIGILSTLMPH